MSQQSKKKKALNCMIDGVSYQSRLEAARQYGKTPQLVYERMKSGKTLDEAVKEDLKIEKMPVDLSNGHRYDSFRAACKGENVPYSTALSRYHNGLPIDQVFAKGKQYREKVVILGVSYSSKKAACEQNGVNYKTATSHMRRKQCNLETAILYLKEKENT